MAQSFDEKIALEYGLPEAILLNNIVFWEKQNRLNERNLHNGRYWTYNSFKAFKGLFPYLSERTLKRAIQHLVEADLILVGSFDDDKFKHTSFYTLTDRAMEYFSERPNRECQNGTIGSATMAQSSIYISNIENTNTNINNTDITLGASLVSAETKRKKELFEQFWKAYPKCKRKVDKKGCEIAFLKIKNLEQIYPNIMASLEAWKREWVKDDYKFTPMTHKWITHEYWEVVDMRGELEAKIEDTTKANHEDFLL